MTCQLIVSDVGSLGSALDHIELRSLNAEDRPRVTQAKKATSELFNELQSTMTDFLRFISKPPRGLQSLKKHAPVYVAGGFVLGLLGQGPDIIIAVHSHKKPTKTSGHSPSKPTTSKKSKAPEWLLTTVPNTSVKEFQSFIRTLPDKGVGKQAHYESPTRYQSYVGRMTQKQAEAVNRVLLVDQMVSNEVTIVFDEVSDFKIDNGTKHDGLAGHKDLRRNPVDPNVIVQQHDPSFLHLKMLSAPERVTFEDLTTTRETDRTLDYAYSQTAGAGTIIYVIDTGFRWTHTVKSLKQCNLWNRV